MNIVSTPDYWDEKAEIRQIFHFGKSSEVKRLTQKINFDEGGEKQ
jgi:hypothetical protein